MSKKIKSVFSAALALIIALAALPAFALNTGDTVYWCYGEDCYDVCTYEGKVTENKINILPNENTDYSCVSFTPDENGYYAVFFDSTETYAELGRASKNDVIYDSNDYIISWNDETSAMIFKAEKNSEIFFSFSTFFCSENGTAAEIEYLGDGVSDIALTFGENDFLVIDCDIYCHGNDNGWFDVYIYSGAEITFTSGKSIFCDNLFEGKASSEIKPGSNDFTVEFLSQELPVTAVCREMSELIEDVEISNPDKYKSFKICINGTIVPEIIDETVTVTFTDGSKTAFEYSSEDFSTVTLPNGRDYAVFVNISEDENGELYLSIYIGDICLKNYPTEIVLAPIKDNAGALVNEWKNCADLSSYFIESSVHAFFGGDMETARDYIGLAAEQFSYAIDIFFIFLAFCFVSPITAF